MAQWGDVAIGPLDAEGRPWWELRCGRWQDVLADVERVDALITDPPYSERTHAAYRAMPTVGRAPIGYLRFSAADVGAFGQRWFCAAVGWCCVMSDHLLVPHWEASAEASGRYAFSPIACVEPGARVRLSGDGPAQWAVQLNVSRPRNREFQQWGSLPGGYVVPASEGWRGGARNGVMGSKPLWLMRAIVRDYSRPGDLVCDPCAGGATTLIAAVTEGRRAIGAEMDPATFALAVKRLRRGWTPDLFARAPQPAHEAEQRGLFDDGDE